MSVQQLKVKKSRAVNHQGFIFAISMTLFLMDWPYYSQNKAISLFQRYSVPN